MKYRKKPVVTRRWRTPKSIAHNKAQWDKAIAESENLIKRLRVIIKDFTRHRNAGHDFPVVGGDR